MMRRRMRFAAVLVVVVLALTGFSTSSSGKSRSGKSSSGKSSGSGGGCSNSKKSNGGYHDYDNDDYDSSSSGSSGGTDYGTPTPTATTSDVPEVRVVRCAQPRKGKRKAVTSSLVELKSMALGSQTYEVEVTFLDALGNTVDSAETTATLDHGFVKDLVVRMDNPRKVSKVKRCRVTAELRP
ncbi:hypothetical protein ACIGJO_34915 [Streptomyces sp. NPDC079020]|uniref:hypothetical protein n=1 Tax=Streptomyces sp. NPDC079020 TaxID=3365722 RepID=UPI0037CF2A09